MSDDYADEGYDADEGPSHEEIQHRYEEAQLALRLMRSSMADARIFDDLRMLGVSKEDHDAPLVRSIWDSALSIFNETKSIDPTLLRQHLDTAVGERQSKDALDLLNESEPLEPGTSLSGVVGALRKKVALRRMDKLRKRLGRLLGDADAHPGVIAGEMHEELNRIEMQSVERRGATPFEIGEIANGIISDPAKMFEVVPTGISQIDITLGGGLPRGFMSILRARAGVGKTSYADHVVLAACHRRIPTLVFSLEADRKEKVKTLMQQLAGCRAKRDPNDVTREEHSKLAEAAARLSGYQLWIEDGSGWTIDRLISTMRVYLRDSAIGLAVIDYVQRVKVGARMNRVEGFEVVSERLSDTAKEDNIAVLALSQHGSGTGGKDTKEADVEATAGSRKFYFDCAVCLDVTRASASKDSNESNMSTIAVTKNRPTGSRVEAKMKWSSVTTRLTSVIDEPKATTKTAADATTSHSGWAFEYDDDEKETA